MPIYAAIQKADRTLMAHTAEPIGAFCPRPQPPGGADAKNGPATGGILHVQIEADSNCQWVVNDLTSSPTVGSGDGVREISIPASAARTLRLTIAGAIVVIQQERETCEYSLPGDSIYAPADGLEFRVPVTTAPDCTWSADSRFEQLARVDPINGSGPGFVTVTVLPNESAFARRVGLRIAGQSLNVYQARTCHYKVQAPSRLGAGSGVANYVVTPSELCYSTTAETNASWIHFTPGSSQFTVEPNTTGENRTAQLRLSGQPITVTQEAAGPRTPLIVEPNDKYGGGGVFRFTYLDGALTSQLSEARIEFGPNCVSTYHRATRTFETPRNGDCVFYSQEAEASGGLLTLRVGVSFLVQGTLGIMADGRQLGVVHTESPPEVGLVQPRDRSNGYGRVQIQTSSSAGIGGLFRFVFNPALRTDTLVFNEVIGQLEDGCAFSYDATAGTIALYGDNDRPGSQAKFGSQTTDGNSKCLLDAGKSSLITSGQQATLDVFLMFRSSWAGQKYVSVVPPPGSGFYPEWLEPFHVTAAVTPPVVFAVPGLLRIGLASAVPIEQARVALGKDCTVTYSRTPASIQAAGSCALTQSQARTEGNDLILVLGFRSPLTGPVSVAQTPQGGIDSGLLPVGALQVR